MTNSIKKNYKRSINAVITASLCSISRRKYINSDMIKHLGAKEYKFKDLRIVYLKDEGS